VPNERKLDVIDRLASDADGHPENQGALRRAERAG
jgi:hypothetical protein